MKRFDYESILAGIAAKKKKDGVFAVIFGVVFAVIFVVGLILVTYQTRAIYMVSFSIALSILACLFVYFLFLGFLPRKKKMTVMENILSSYLSEVQGKVSKIGGPIRLSNGLDVYEIYLENSDSLSVIYQDTIFGEVSFKIGSCYRVEKANGIVIEMEEYHEE